MRANRRRDTGPELELRSSLFSRGLRYRVDYPIRAAADARPIRPDVVFPGAKLAVFVDGCFWHCCPRHGTRPGRNSEYWDAKLQRNVDRDRRYDALLREAGWTVIRVWEHEDPEEAAAALERTLSSSRRVA
jgi:DNA mismatch endonuclease (patch repair protein)